MSLNFNNAKSTKEIQAIYDYTIDAFSDTPDFKWNLEEIKNELKNGWSLVSVTNDDKEVVAALFYRLEGKDLLTKNTGLKINHQGSGYSHQIKEFFESVAKENKAKRILHYCRIDNFRTYSLNESHGYEKTTNTSSDGTVVEWEKKI